MKIAFLTAIGLVVSYANLEDIEAIANLNKYTKLCPSESFQMFSLQCIYANILYLYNCCVTVMVEFLFIFSCFYCYNS
jgi:hypothetical protein